MKYSKGFFFFFCLNSNVDKLAIKPMQSWFKITATTKMLHIDCYVQHRGTCRYAILQLKPYRLALPVLANAVKS